MGSPEGVLTVTVMTLLPAAAEGKQLQEKGDLRGRTGQRWLERNRRSEHMLGGLSHSVPGTHPCTDCPLIHRKKGLVRFSLTSSVSIAGAQSHSKKSYLSLGLGP